MFHRAYFFPAPVHVLSGRLVADELFAHDRVLSFGKPLKVLFTNLAAQSPLLGEFAMPFARVTTIVLLAGAFAFSFIAIWL